MYQWLKLQRGDEGGAGRGGAGRVAARVQARCLFTYVIRFTFKKIYGRDLLIVTRLLRWKV